MLHDRTTELYRDPSKRSFYNTETIKGRKHLSLFTWGRKYEKVTLRTCDGKRGKNYLKNSRDIKYRLKDILKKLGTYFKPNFI